MLAANGRRLRSRAEDGMTGNMFPICHSPTVGDGGDARW
jgi:hypothetical protein